MLPDFLPAAEALAKGVRHVASYIADSIAECRKGFDDAEAGDYLACAGADALADTFGRMECEGPDAADAEWDGSSPPTWWPMAWYVDQLERVILTSSDPAAVQAAGSADPARAVSDGTHHPLAPSAPPGSTSAAIGVAADEPSVIGVADDGPAEACDIPPSPSAGHLKTATCKHCSRAIELVEGVAVTPYGRAAVWMHAPGGGHRCKPTYADPK